ncbi:Hypothetical protein CINCED_3A014820 [Cinara cedri]|uniref:Uncharacterized protein n=1 Tax=Cinara cedri TaxID=506608 RepID=A0A5E4M3F2_9HEMI|nr:Hypothetical protein CINCED_3A014820 [Cinara cedri]
MFISAQCPGSIFGGRDYHGNPTYACPYGFRLFAGRLRSKNARSSRSSPPPFRGLPLTAGDRLPPVIACVANGESNGVPTRETSGPPSSLSQTYGP